MYEVAPPPLCYRIQSPTYMISHINSMMDSFILIFFISRFQDQKMIASYLGSMLACMGDHDAAVTGRVRNSWLEIFLMSREFTTKTNLVYYHTTGLRAYNHKEKEKKLLKSRGVGGVL